MYYTNVICNTNLNYDFRFFKYSTWSTAAILIWKIMRLNGKMDITNKFCTPKIAILHVLHKYELWFWTFTFSIWPTTAILNLKSLRLNGKMDITNEFYIPKIAILYVLYKSELWFWNFQYGLQLPSWLLKKPPWRQIEKIRILTQDIFR